MNIKSSQAPGKILGSTDVDHIPLSGFKKSL